MGVSFSHCNKDKKEAPLIPPKSSFVMDMSAFKDASQDDKGYGNFGFSALTIGFWHTVLTVRMAVPVIAYVGIIGSNEAIYQSEQTWLWSHDFSIAGKTYSASLYGKVENDSTDWKMYISNEGVYNDFLWFSGKNSLDLKGGYWILKDNPTSNKDVFRIDWNATGEELGNIRYSDIEQGGENNGSYIAFGNDNTDGIFSCYYDIYNAKKAQLTEVEWDKKVKGGRVRDEVHFGDNYWHCWDEKAKDIDCSVLVR